MCVERNVAKKGVKVITRINDFANNNKFIFFLNSFENREPTQKKN